MRRRWEGRQVSDLAHAWDLEALEIHDRLGSTADRLRERVDGGLRPWAVVLAEAQTAGRGRDGRVWSSVAGRGLWMSVLAPALTDGRPAPLLAGVAVAEAIERAFAPLAPRLKWPNDVELGGRKIAGILCETAPGAPLRIGIGVNVLHHREDFPPELQGLATSIVEAGGPTEPGSRARLAGAILERLRAAWSAPASAWHAAWSARDALHGRQVRCDAGPSGEAMGVDEAGGLRVRTSEGSVVVVRSGGVRAVVDSTADAPPQP
ncbi:MAG: biotin--[acetyl-CoA-carboxylase] ligase [Gemmatimonadetes bacterium]|nr:biotin--[acetyl-CoA-carboxylase] ligase [Gemmatimonadota bacterium]